MRGWQAKKRRTCALPVDKGYARKCKTTRSAGGYLFYVCLAGTRLDTLVPIIFARHNRVRVGHYISEKQLKLAKIASARFF